MNIIQYNNFRRKVFNAALLECFGRIQLECCCGSTDKPLNGSVGETARKMSDAFYVDLLKLDTAPISQTKKNLSEAVTFIKDCVNISEAIATDKANTARDEDLEIDNDQEIELSDEDQELIDKVFDEKNPEVQVDAVRDATVKALLAEDKKAQEIRDSLSIAQSQVAVNDNPNSLEETVTRLNHRGPTSLMNAIMNATASAAVTDINEHSETPVSVGKIMAENAEMIKERASMMYMLYEASSVFGIKTYTSAEVKAEAEKIYYNK